LTLLKAKTKNLVLVTMRNNKENLLKQLEKIKIKDIFSDIIVCGSMMQNPKYDALKDIKFNSAIIIGDTEEDTNTAKLLGIKSIGILNGLRVKRYLDADFFCEELYNINLNDFKI